MLERKDGLGSLMNVCVTLVTFICLAALTPACSSGGGGTKESSVAKDTAAPVISASAPSGVLPAGTTVQIMSVTTNENATCKYSRSDTDYSGMTDMFSITGGTTHSQPVSGLLDGQAYTYYVRCLDGQGNSNTSSKVISWSVARTGTGSAVLEWGVSVPDATHSSADGYRIYHCGPASGTCTNFSELATVAVSAQTYTAAGLESGTHCFEVRAYNSAGVSDPADCNSNSNTGCCKSIP